MLFVYGNGACVGYMVFIGDFIPAIIALMLPEEAWAQNTTGITRTVSIAVAAALLIPMMMLPEDLSRLKFLQPVSIVALMYMSLVVALKSPSSFKRFDHQPSFGDVRLITVDAHFFEEPFPSASSPSTAT
ncbi:unnamed protein product [Effrenium voratum]|nr:unnamed protein product [Effrenium voratum]